MNPIFNIIAKSGNYSLPYLVTFHNEDNSSVIRVTNSNHNITYDNVTFNASSFSFNPNESSNGFNGGGNLEITLAEKNVFDFSEDGNSFYVEVINVVEDANGIHSVNLIDNHFGALTINKNKLTFSFNSDDRASMTFPTLTFNNNNNPGNA